MYNIKNIISFHSSLPLPSPPNLRPLLTHCIVLNQQSACGWWGFHFVPKRLNISTIPRKLSVLYRDEGGQISGLIIINITITSGKDGRISKQQNNGRRSSSETNWILGSQPPLWYKMNNSSIALFVTHSICYWYILPSKSWYEIVWWMFRLYPFPLSSSCIISFVTPQASISSTKFATWPYALRSSGTGQGIYGGGLDKSTPFLTWFLSFLHPFTICTYYHIRTSRFHYPGRSKFVPFDCRWNPSTHVCGYFA